MTQLIDKAIRRLNWQIKVVNLSDDEALEKVEKFFDISRIIYVFIKLIHFCLVIIIEFYIIFI